ncbi:pimeloyl-ACP methyl ester carboxylesterase [Nocardia transvalensis]|uniref:Pimeloyl-ACP methyl ester carboxylesterase n=1 Tax=Nocardia transvalensis TaxID=37333 RepID=A0A7W9PDN2_9NOCA|nr:alpha/beta hydrolase [Nocardia transvalensis]MBB5914001.1 pimeloyl-ACP methyl ester carboxylesterase [Nocardia transvalensis]
MKTRRTARAVAWACAAFLAVQPAGVAGADDRAAFGECPDGAVTPGGGAECAVVSVPRDYADAGGPRIELTVSRIRATGERNGTIFANPGGPGADSLDFWSRRSAGLPAEIGRHYDRVAVQPRGLRWATPLDCGANGKDRGATRAACDATQPGYVATITTENTARDMDAVRDALGLDRIDFFGTSYGTYLGAVYASLFPQRVDRMVLDSSVHPDWVWNEQFAQQQLAGKQRLDDLFTWIAQHDGEYHLGATPLRVYENWVRMVVAQGGGWYANLTPPPASTADLPGDLPAPIADLARDGFNGGRDQIGQLQNLIRALATGGTSAQVPMVSATAVATYTRSFWPTFARAMADASVDPTDTRQLRAIEDVAAPGATGRNVFSAITCNENAVPGRMELLAAAAATVASGGNALDARADMVRSGVACADWDPVTTPVAIADHGLPTPPLVLQSRHDAVTEYDGGPGMAAALRGHLITVEGGDHGTFGRNNPTVDQAVLTYLRTGKVTISHADQAPID